MIDGKSNRHAVIPEGPKIGNKYFANDELPCTDAIEIRIMAIGQKRLNIFISPFVLTALVRSHYQSIGPPQ